MSGVAVPVYLVVEPFGKDAAALPPLDPGGATLPIPVASQVGIIQGAASFADGFPAATMSDPESEGGTPPFGQDMNGILYTLSQYALLMQAGQLAPFSSVAAAAFGGYALGAKVASVATPGVIWTNNLAGNTVDPDVTPTNWISSVPLSVTTTPAAGTFNNVALPGASDYAWDVDTTAGNVNFTGIVARRNGQKLFITCTGANLLQFLALNGGSAAANQFRAPSDLAVVQNQTLTMQWFLTQNKWLFV